jgi:tRNA G10  N-methylase Trm11
MKKLGLDARVFASDFFATCECVDRVVTDLPYGRATKKITGAGFDARFTAKLADTLKKNGSAAVVFDRPLEGGAFAPEKILGMRVHRSLGRFVHIFRKNP